MFCDIKVHAFVQQQPYTNYDGSFLKMNSTFAIEVTDVPQSTSSKSIYIEGSFAETDIKPRCSNYKEYMKLDITMCDSSALEITQIYSSVRYGLKFSYAQEKQEIGFASLF